jgi:hypothetical protein
MMDDSRTPRRSMLAGIGAAVAAFAFGAGGADAQTRHASFQPARHPQDEWFDQVPGRHRTIIDCAMPNTAAGGLFSANNLYEANRTGYQLGDKDLAIVVCLRHFATPFAYTDAVWTKYGAAFSGLLQFTDPKTKEAPTVNVLNASGYGPLLPNMGITLSQLVARGTQFAVCNMATQEISAAVAGRMKLDPKAVYHDFVSNLIPSSHLAAAGVVAVNRAQEYGYTLLTMV